MALQSLLFDKWINQIEKGELIYPLVKTSAISPPVPKHLPFPVLGLAFLIFSKTKFEGNTRTSQIIEFVAILYIRKRYTSSDINLKV